MSITYYCNTMERLDDSTIVIYPNNMSEVQTKILKDERIIDIPTYLEESQKKPKLTYHQDWPAYNQAQTIEKDFFQRILDELLMYVQEPELNRRGRPSVPLRDQLMALCLQQYVGLSSRRSTCDIKAASEKHYLLKGLHFNTLLKSYNNPIMTGILKQLIEISSTPLACVETQFAIDSSGFSTSQFVRWFDVKYQKQSSRRKFKKAHITSGVKTNIITSVNVTPGTQADGPELPELLKRTTKYFQVDEVSADKAYLSRTNLLYINKIGAVPYIPFKKNSKGNKNGMFWAKMYRYFTHRQEEFMQHYHVRSNVETTFSMMKRKSGMKLRTKNDLSQTNEILVKCLIHNICVLIQEYFELGIDVEFSKYSILGADGINVQNSQN